MEACIELAKIYEHKLKQYKEAIYYTEKALEIQLKQNKEKLEDLSKRLKRLNSKQGSFKE